MAETTWDSVFTQTFGNNSRDFTIKSGKDTTVPVKICNSFCNFQIKDWEFKQYITGMSVTGAKNLLRINPAVDTAPPPKGLEGTATRTGKTTKRTADQSFEVYWNGDFNSTSPAFTYFTGGKHDGYSLVEIFIQAPSKFLYMDRRYDMEVGLVFQNKKNSRKVIMVTPMTKAASEKAPTDPTLKGFYETMVKMSHSIPPDGDTHSVEGVEMWTPRMFLPRKGKQKFIRWTDAEDAKLNYIVFFSPESALPVPPGFYNNFVHELAGGTMNMSRMKATPGKRMPSNTFLEVNENIPAVDVQIRTECKEVVDPLIQATVHEYIELTDKQAKEPPTPLKCPKVEREEAKKWFQNVWMWIAIVAIVACVLIFIFRDKIKHHVGRLVGRGGKTGSGSVGTPTALGNVTPVTPSTPTNVELTTV